MFVDQARIFAKSGKGGDGMISFRREKFVSMGGPDGGDGGDGGSIIFIVNPKINSLVKFHKQVHFRAGNGKNGGRKKQQGPRGQTLRLEVPPGTLVREEETNTILADLTEEDQEFVMLRGGKGGRGNIHFTTSIHQAPRIADRGEPSDEKWLILELKLIADVGLVGVPNAGKSTLLSVVSAARPKIASYPFTTLQPNLGVVELDDYETMVLADIPGLIEGAAAGIGLGHDFLRHVERTRVLIHLLNGAADEPLEEWAMINQELSLYDEALSKKPQLVVFNKMDLPDAIAWEPLIEERIVAEGHDFCSISSVTRQGVREMLYRVKRMLDEAPEPQPFYEETAVIRPEDDEHAFVISRENDGWRVSGKRIERIAAMTYFEFDTTAQRFQRILENLGITDALNKAGVVAGDTVYIANEVLEWGEG